MEPIELATEAQSDIQILKPSWTTIQQAVQVATRAAQEEHEAYVLYTQAKDRLTKSHAYQEMERAEKVWAAKAKYSAGRCAHRDSVIKSALGLTEDEVVK